MTMPQAGRKEGEMRKCFVCKKSHKTNRSVCRDCERQAVVRGRSCSRLGKSVRIGRSARILTSIMR